LDSTPPVRVLVVEDEPRISGFLRRGFTARGYAVEIVDQGRHALERFPHADVIVLDLGLPDMDGIEVLQQLRERDQDVPVIVLTARSSVENRVHALELGADDYVTKPFSFDELAARVDATLRRTIPAPAPARGCHHRILIVEDRARMASFVARGLARAGLEVIVAGEADVGRFLAAHERFDLVIVDLGLPGTSGLDLVRSLHTERPELPIILMTGRDEPETRTKAIAAGATDYVTAPFGIEDIQRRVLASLRTGES
jgi:DNA-binding response OmpR family regulator